MEGRPKDAGIDDGLPPGLGFNSELQGTTLRVLPEVDALPEPVVGVATRPQMVAANRHTLRYRAVAPVVAHDETVMDVTPHAALVACPLHPGFLRC